MENMYNTHKDTSKDRHRSQLLVAIFEKLKKSVERSMTTHADKSDLPLVWNNEAGSKYEVLIAKEEDMTPD